MNKLYSWVYLIYKVTFKGDFLIQNYNLSYLKYEEK